MHETRTPGMHRLIACMAYGFEGGQHSDAARIGSGDAVVAQLHHQAELNKGRVDRDCIVRRPVDVSGGNGHDAGMGGAVGRGGVNTYVVFA